MNEDSRAYSSGIWTVKPGNEEAFKNARKDSATWTSKNAEGAMSVQFLESEEDPRKFITDRSLEGRAERSFVTSCLRIQAVLRKGERALRGCQTHDSEGHTQHVNHGKPFLNLFLSSQTTSLGQSRVPSDVP